MSTVRPCVFWPLAITAGVNDKLDFKIGATTYAATVAAATYYSPEDLCTAVAAAMTAQVANAWSIVRVWSAASEVPKIRISGTSAFELLFATGTNHDADIAEVLGFLELDRAAATSQTGNGQHVNGWYAPDPVITETPERPLVTRVVTRSLGGRTVANEYGVPRYSKTVGFGFLPAQKVWQTSEGTDYLNEAIERWFLEGWARFRWWSDATAESTYADYLFDEKTAGELPHNRLSPGNPLYSLALQFFKFVA